MEKIVVLSLLNLLLFAKRLTSKNFISDIYINNLNVAQSVTAIQ